MRKHRLLLPLVVDAALAVGAASSAAGKPGSNPCDGGTLDSGTYQGFTVSGTCDFAPGASITILGNLTLARGAVLIDHASVPASVHVTGNSSRRRGQPCTASAAATPTDRDQPRRRQVRS